uniref:Uncharacterized protein n=1 Tax=Udotea flabellum TaxID=170437 RepID=A0A386B1V6_9CHLO|nr:hypothetical protein [Udotea flabellum]AYC65680.1 hypothetical protein [Udotea flabellum]
MANVIDTKRKRTSEAALRGSPTLVHTPSPYSTAYLPAEGKDTGAGGRGMDRKGRHTPTAYLLPLPHACFPVLTLLAYPCRDRKVRAHRGAVPAPYGVPYGQGRAGHIGGRR